jgi:hypothetical protein
MTHVQRTLALYGVVLAIAVIPMRSQPAPSVYPTGTTIYKPDKTWNGYTVLNATGSSGAAVIDMNGTELKRWEEMRGYPPRVLPGGYIMGGLGTRRPHLETVTFAQLDWDGDIVWQYDGSEQVQTGDGETVWSARQHHDWQREGSPVGYYAPGAEPLVSSGRTLLLSHRNLINSAVSDKRLEDDYIVEISWDGEVLWEWLASDHIDELGFSEDARNAIYRSVQWNEARQSADWLHLNSASYIGPNRWYQDGDERFHPDNIIISSRAASIVAIIDRTGSVVWRIGPDYRESKAMRELGQVIAQHHPHIIPEGLPGAGNLLVFDNGGASGYGTGNPGAPNGRNIVTRSYSRVLELNPVTLEKVWEYTMPNGPNFFFYSTFVSSAQRLPNGNTLITEGAAGRVFEVTTDNEIVWEYLNPNFSEDGVPHLIYRAYRIPYDWIPQLSRPEERPIVPPDLSEFRIQP